MPADPTLTPEDVRHVARLARLAIPDAQIEDYRRRLQAILAYANRLAELNLDSVEPMAAITPPDADHHTPFHIAEDRPGDMLPRDTLMKMAPAIDPPYLAVPKVHDAGQA